MTFRYAASCAAAALGLFCSSAAASSADTPPHPAAIAEASALPIAVAATDANIRYVGRFDRLDSAGPRCTWPASTVVVHFNGTDLNARLSDGGSDDRWQVEIDGKPGAMLTLSSGPHLYRLAAGLTDGEHTVRLVKATEVFVGTTQVLGFQLNDGGAILQPPLAKRRIEVIGDSISCGYGNEGKSENDHFSPKTENAYLTYGAMTARKLNADYVCIAWSGRKMWPDNTIPEIYELNLPFAPASKWSPDLAAWTPDVILINLATNDFNTANPDEAKWTSAYKGFIARLRGWYPKAEVYCALGPCMSDAGEGARKPYTALTTYINEIVGSFNSAGDTHVHVIEFAQQKRSDGLGADWHPSVRTHEIMADKLSSTLQADLKW